MFKIIFPLHLTCGYGYVPQSLMVEEQGHQEQKEHSYSDPTYRCMLGVPYARRAWNITPVLPSLSLPCCHYREAVVSLHTRCLSMGLTILPRIVVRKACRCRQDLTKSVTEDV